MAVQENSQNSSKNIAKKTPKNALDLYFLKIDLLKIP